MDDVHGYRIDAGRILAGDNSEISVVGNVFDLEFDPYAFVMSSNEYNYNVMFTVRGISKGTIGDYAEDENFDMCTGYDAYSGNWYYYDCDGQCEAYNEDNDYYFYYKCGESPRGGQCFNPTESYYYDCFIDDCYSYSTLALDYDAWENGGYYYYHSCDSPGFGGLCIDAFGNRYDCDYSAELCTATHAGEEYYYDCKE